MTLQTITLQIPEHIYERAQQMAETTDQPLEAVFLHELENAFLPPLPEDEEAELSALNYLSDEALWTIAREQMPSPRQERMQGLMDGNTKGTLSEAEYQELEHLVEQGQKLMLRKGKAAALLTERGYKVTRESLRG
ncbi:MAG: hypothetical protein BroJett018_22000 [Chloroflexota bacterium]|nr:hypothetical protein [Chloroflexota bacterium]NOG65491.1 hypothetical protein [Chloroflexota bacterium]GIK64406.1 MAG: hypothetical protein BroJett018_22000 [Chloroflexota bacterium]